MEVELKMNLINVDKDFAKRFRFYF